MLFLAGAIRRELGEPVYLWHGQFQLHAVDDADLQRRAEPTWNPQDVEHDRLHPGLPAHALRARARLQRVPGRHALSKRGRRASLDAWRPTPAGATLLSPGRCASSANAWRHILSTQLLPQPASSLSGRGTDARR